MCKFIIYDGPNFPDEPTRMVNGDMIGAIDDHHDFGTEELALELFACIEVPGMTLAEGLDRIGAFNPDSTGRYIDRPSLYWLDLDDVVGIGRNKKGYITINKAVLISKFKTRDPLLNPNFSG
jgi:hypothetical protein